MDVPMVLEYCANCGIPFAMTQDLQSKLLKCHNTFYCPKGHGQSYTGKSAEEILKEKLADREHSLEYFRKLEAARAAESRKKYEAKMNKLKAARLAAKKKAKKS